MLAPQIKSNLFFASDGVQEEGTDLLSEFISQFVHCDFMLLLVQSNPSFDIGAGDVFFWVKLGRSDFET